IFYMATGRAGDAEPYFRLMAETAKTVEARLTLAQYYIEVKRQDEGRRLLQQIAEDKDGFAIASVRLAALDMADGHGGEAEAGVAAVLKKYPYDVMAQVLEAELLFDDGKRELALKAVTAAIANDPNVASAHAVAGRVLAALDRYQDAVKQYEDVLKLD